MSVAASLRTDNRSLLWLLGLGTFAIGIDAFVVAGVLDHIASDMHVTPALAGQLITIFAVSYAVLAPLSAWLLAGLNRKKVLLLALAIFVVGNVLSVLASSFEILALSRAVAALGAATYTPQALGAVSLLVEPERKGRALSIVYGGMTVATALGVPFGTLLGQTFGWRFTFAGIVAIGVLTFGGLALVLPDLAAPGVHRLRDRLSAIGNPAVLLTLSITFLAALSEHSVYSYISLILADVRWGENAVLPLALVFFGAGAVIGNAISGYATDRIGSRAVLLVSIAVQSLALLALSFVYWHPLLSSAILLVWGIAGWTYLVPIQHRLLGQSKTYGPFTVSLNSSVLYLGIGGGGALGGAFIAAFGPYQLGFLAFALGILSLATAVFAYRAD